MAITPINGLDPLSMLPRKIGIKIFSYLDPEGIIACSKVNHLWRETSHEQPLCTDTEWKNFLLDRVQAFTNTVALNQLSQFECVFHFNPESSFSLFAESSPDGQKVLLKSGNEISNTSKSGQMYMDDDRVNTADLKPDVKTTCTILYPSANFKTCKSWRRINFGTNNLQTSCVQFEPRNLPLEPLPMSMDDWRNQLAGIIPDGCDHSDLMDHLLKALEDKRLPLHIALTLILSNCMKPLPVDNREKENDPGQADRKSVV